MRDPTTVAVPKARAPVYLEKAEKFFAQAEAALQDGNEEAAALLAVHVAISGADAITVAKVGCRCADPEHMDVVRVLDRCDLPGKEELRKQLRAILGRKNLIEYEDRLLPRGDASVLVKQAARVLGAARAALAPSSSP